jgi:hypothetical protein
VFCASLYACCCPSRPWLVGPWEPRPAPSCIGRVSKAGSQICSCVPPEAIGRSLCAASLIVPPDLHRAGRNAPLATACRLSSGSPPPAVNWRHARSGSISVILTMRRSLPVHPGKQTFSEPVGMPQRCQFLTHAPQQNASCDMPATFGLPSTAYMALRRENWRYALRNATSARPNA